MAKTIFSKKLIEKRKENKFTQKDVAKKLNMTARQYGYLEHDHITCGYWDIITLCQLFNISANELFGIGEKVTLIFPENN